MPIREQEMISNFGVKLPVEAYLFMTLNLMNKELCETLAKKSVEIDFPVADS